MKKYFLLTLFLITILMPSRVFGSVINLVQTPTIGPVGSPVVVTVLVDPGVSLINALQGEIVVPPGISVKSFDDSGTFVSAWIEKPSLKDGKVIFSGITPGGFKGLVQPTSSKLTPGVLFKFTLTAERSGLSISPQNILLYEKAGERITSFTAKPLIIQVADGVPAGILSGIEKDTHPPEPFTVQIANDADIFKGKDFLVFSTTDSGTGVDFYSIQEGDRKPVTGESPYLLQDQFIRGPIIVRAYDRAGNVQEVILNPKTMQSTRPYYIIIGIILLVFLSSKLFSWKKRSF